jgi:inosine/xanthosine triphosphatase
MVKADKAHPVAPYEERRRALGAFLKKKKLTAEIGKITNVYGFALEDRFDAIVVSPDTRKNAEKINEKRLERGLKPLEIVEIPFVLSKDTLPISSIRIKRNEIDCEGKRLRPIRIAVGSTNDVKINAAKKAFERALRVECIASGFDVDSGVKAQPIGDETVRGAINRAKAALEKSPEAEFGVGIEAGLFWNEFSKQYFDVQYCAIADRHGRVTLGHGSGFAYPEPVANEIRKGRTIGDVMSELAGIENIGKKMGAVGHLSKGAIERTELTEQAVLMALIPRI